MLSVVGWAVSAVTLICSVLSAHWAADAPQGYKLTGCVCVHIMFMWDGDYVGGTDRMGWQEEKKTQRKSGCMVSHSLIFTLAAAMFTSLNRRRQQGETTRPKALNAMPPITGGKKHKLSPCWLIL